LLAHASEQGGSVRLEALFPAPLRHQKEHNRRDDRRD
jgi:hypothetical protein